MRDLGKCQNADCKKDAEITHPGNGFNYCHTCDTNINKTLEIMREDDKINRRIYGNPEGTIDINEYWERDP